MWYTIKVVRKNNLLEVKNLKQSLRRYMKVIENIKNIGHAIANGYRRLGEIDCPDEEAVLEGDTAEIKELKNSLERVNTIENKYHVSNSSSAKGGKGKSSNIVERVDTNSLEAVKKVEAKTEERVNDGMER